MHTGAECKRHKIKCEVIPGESSCTKCLRSGLKCVANDFSQRFVDDDGMYVGVSSYQTLAPLYLN